MRTLLLLSLMIFGATTFAEDEFYFAKSGDKRMEAAMSKAKSTLGHFLKAAKERTEKYDAYSAYIKFEENGETEYLWLVDVKPYDDKYFMGVVISEPRLIKRYKYGQTIGFLPSDIYDWQLKDSKSGEISGAFTICAMTDPESKEDVKYIKNNNFACNL